MFEYFRMSSVSIVKFYGIRECSCSEFCVVKLPRRRAVASFEKFFLDHGFLEFSKFSEITLLNTVRYKIMKFLTTTSAGTLTITLTI